MPDGEDRCVPPNRHPALVAARRLADELLFPAAEQVDATAVPASHLRAVAGAGLLGLLAPVSAGGLEAPPAVVREVTEILAGADLATWFVQAQHHSPVRMLARTGNRPELLADLAAGRTLAGIAFSHLRRHPARPVTATRVAGGWRFDGAVRWYTGWGLNQVVLLGAATDDGRIVFALLPATESEVLRPGRPLALAALQASRTIGFTLHGAPAGDDEVVEVLPFETWLAGARKVSVNPNPAVFGVADRALSLLAAHGAAREEPSAVVAAERIGARIAQVRADSYALVDATPADRPLTEAEVAPRLRLRARAHQLSVQATTALVLAGAGRAMALSSPAQRLAREALFLLVQAQTAEVRAAALERWAAGL